MWKNLFFSILAFTIILNCESVPYAYQKPSVEKQESFEELMRKDALDKKTRTIAAANQFLNDNPEDTVAAVLIENRSNCNIIIKISGQKNYTLPIPKNGKNFLVIPKGNYLFQGKVCNSDYRSSKNIVTSISVNLSDL